MLVAEDADRKEVSSQQKVLLPDVCPQCSRAICSCLAVGKDPLSVCCFFSLSLSVCVYVCIFVSDSLARARSLSRSSLSHCLCDAGVRNIQSLLNILYHLYFHHTCCS
jgi:hypothetical protein